jgi:hypothetical protein
MKRSVVETSLLNNPKILVQHPHYIHRLIEMVTDEWQPTPSQYERLVTHLIGCLHCQVALGMLVVLERDYARSSSSPVGLVERLLSQITEIIHETTIRNQITAYIEMLEAKGEKKANKKFPRLFEHLQRCKACQCAVEETRDLLHRAKEAGLIDP